MKLAQSIQFKFRPSLLALLSLVMGNSAWSATIQPVQTNQVAPIEVNSEVQIEVPTELKNKVDKLRIRNLITGKEITVGAGSTPIFRVQNISIIVDSAKPMLAPEISVLIFKASDANTPAEGAAAESVATPNPQKLGGYSFTKSLIFDQPYWRKVGFRVKSLPSGGARISLDAHLHTRVLNGVQAEVLTQNAVSSQGKSDLDEAFKALGNREHTRAIKLFTSIIQKPNISSDERAKAYLGRGMALYHKEGCASIDGDMMQAEKDPANADDISYFRGLCLVDKGKLDDAEGLFRELVKKESKIYAEKSRFYLGVIGENAGRYDEAESTYLDIIDFSSDKELIVLAKARLEAVKLARKESKGLVTGLVSFGVGYDSNVFVLPSNVTPTLGVSGKADTDYLGLASFDLRLPYWSKIDHHLHYTFLALHYSKSPIAHDYDIQSHDLGTSVSFVLTERDAMTGTADFNAIFKGPIKDFSEYLATAGGGLEWQHIFGAKDDPSSRMTVGYGMTYVNPIAVQISGFDITAYSHTIKYRQQFLKRKPYVFGPGVDLEWRRALGAQNTLFGTALVGFFEMPVGPESWKLSFAQEGAIATQFFYDSTVADSADAQLAIKRKDGSLRYNASLARIWGQSIETRLQFIGSVTDSSRNASRYKKAQLNLLVSAFF